MEGQLKDITIFSDEEYSSGQTSDISDMQSPFSSLQLNEQLALVEKKIQKYNKLRDKLRYRLSNCQQMSKDQEEKQILSESQDVSSSDELTEDNNLLNEDQINTSKVVLVPTIQMLNKQRIKFIKQLREDHPDITFNEICIELNNRNDLKENKFGKFKEIKTSTIQKLVQDLGVNQKPRYLHPDRNKEIVVKMRHMFCQEFLKKIDKQVIILFIDEYTFKLPQLRSTEDSNNKQLNGAKYHSQGCFSLLTCFSITGAAYFKISTAHLEKYDDFQGFFSLIEQASEALELNHNSQSALILDSDKNQNRTGQVCLIMDNSIVNNREKQRRYKQFIKGTLLFLPPHSPQLNPIDQWFQVLRQKIRKSNFSTKKELCQGVHYILKEQENYDYKALVDQSIEQIKRGFAFGRF